MIYIIPICVILFSIYWYDYQGKVRHKDLIYYGLMIYCILISGLSYRMGIDIVSFYEREFYENYLTLDRTSFDYIFHFPKRQAGWMLFASICKSIIPDFNFMKTVIAIVVNYAMFITIRRYTNNIFTGVLLYFLFIFPYLSFEILRESMAVAMFLFSLKYLEKQSLVKYYLWIFIAFMLHESSFFLFFMPLVWDVKFTKKQVYFYALIALLIMIFQSSFRFIPDLFLKIPFFEEKAEFYMNSDVFSRYRTFNISQFYTYVLNVFIPILGIYYTQNDNSFENGDTLKINTYRLYKYVVVYLFITVFSNFFPILFRCENYLLIFFYLYMIILMCFIANRIHNNPILRVLICTIFILYNVVPMYFLPKERYENIPVIVKLYPYTSILNKEVILEREIFYEIVLNNSSR